MGKKFNTKALLFLLSTLLFSGVYLFGVWMLPEFKNIVIIIVGFSYAFSLGSTLTW